VLLVIALLAMWPLGSAHSSQPTPNVKPAVAEDFDGDSIPDLAITASEEDSERPTPPAWAMEVVPRFVELEVAVPHLSPAVW